MATDTLSPEETLLHVLEHVLYVEQLDALHLHLTQLTELLQTTPGLTAKQLGVLDTFPPLQHNLVLALNHHAELIEPKRLQPVLHELQREAQKRKQVRLTVACEFEESDLKEMMAELSQRIGAPVVLRLTVDPTLIAGAVIEHGNFSSDYSVRTRLQQLKKTWTKAVTTDDAR
jgi:hypothetical protein